MCLGSGSRCRSKVFPFIWLVYSQTNIGPQKALTLLPNFRHNVVVFGIVCCPGVHPTPPERNTRLLEMLLLEGPTDLLRCAYAYYFRLESSKGYFLHKLYDTTCSATFFFSNSQGLFKDKSKGAEVSKGTLLMHDRINFGAVYITFAEYEGAKAAEFAQHTTQHMSHSQGYTICGTSHML
jgi:hypothetical protein